ncbi:MAG TPA: VOC family protein [Nocardioidaceae bacterium]|nr:VOC family protein [Nocardioidaceae bacterium]
MTARDTPWPEGTPCWVDLGVDDMEKARAFYSGLFGWEVPEGDPEMGGYSNAVKDGRAVAGLSPKMSPDQPTVWTTYLSVRDAAATMAKVTANGGRSMVEPMAVADLGTMAVAVDPAGAVVGFWQSGAHTGFRLADEPGSVTWNENLSRDWEKNKDFYAAVVGWGFDDMSGDGFEYAAFTVDGDTAGGIGRIGDDWPSDVPPHWNTYFKVAAMPSAVSRLQELGGTVLKEPWETPFGTMAAVSDDQGATFMLMADNAQSLD